MALTALQRDVSLLLAAERRHSGESNKVLALVGRLEARDWIDQLIL
jgi:hypothetical protein